MGMARLGLSLLVGSCLVLLAVACGEGEEGATARPAATATASTVGSPIASPATARPTAAPETLTAVATPEVAACPDDDPAFCAFAAQVEEAITSEDVDFFVANLLDPATAQMTRVPELDNYTEFWLSPDRGMAVVSSPRGPGLGILNLSNLQFTPIGGSVIGYPSESIPQSQLAFSPDGSQIYWVDQGGWAPRAIYKANIDGTGLAEVTQLPGWFGAFSPDLTRVLYFVQPDARQDLWIANLDGSDARLVAEKASDAAWLPQPSLEERRPQ